ncbi:MAG TPA: VanZ family protein [Gammaproteobacteria bacterium]|jgi:VanZ family protein
MADQATTVSVQRTWLTAGLALMALIVWGSLTPSPPQILELPLPQFDKFEHCGAYLLLTAWFTAAFPRRWFWVTLFFAVLGGAVEILQGYTGRDPDWLDWVADCVGIGIGAWFPARWALQVKSWLTVRYARARA